MLQKAAHIEHGRPEAKQPVLVLIGCTLKSKRGHDDPPSALNRRDPRGSPARQPVCRMRATSGNADDCRASQNYEPVR